jgi:hypothetical protein
MGGYSKYRCGDTGQHRWHWVLELGKGPVFLGQRVWTAVEIPQSYSIAESSGALRSRGGDAFDATGLASNSVIRKQRVPRLSL